jgi:hypothetical protein
MDQPTTPRGGHATPMRHAPHPDDAIPLVPLAAPAATYRMPDRPLSGDVARASRTGRVLLSPLCALYVLPLTPLCYVPERCSASPLPLGAGRLHVRFLNSAANCCMLGRSLRAAHHVPLSSPPRPPPYNPYLFPRPAHREGLGERTHEPVTNASPQPSIVRAGEARTSTSCGPPWRRGGTGIGKVNRRRR